MKRWFSIGTAILLVLALIGFGDELILLFKNEQGFTNWQYVANWSSGILIILLSITAIILFFSRRAKGKAITELHAIKAELENRVQERTATLDQSNRHLQEEVEQHLATTTRLHTSEHYIKSILTLMPSMLVGLDAEGVVTQWNKTAEQYTGVKAEDAIGKNLWQVYPIITITPSQVQDALAQQETITIRQSQRGLFHFDIAIYPLHSAGESGVVLLIDDVSHQVKSENKLILRDKISSMGELASSMAHDMNIPLQRMLDEIKLIAETLTPAQTEIGEHLQRAMTQGQQASAIVDNLLDFARSQQHVKQEADICELMDHSVELANNVLSLAQGLAFAEIAIEREYEPNMPKLKCHIAEIQQVFLRLLRHCYHSIGKVQSDDFKPAIRIRILECYEAIWIKISHNGVGLSGEQQQSIFEPYFSNKPLDSDYDAEMRLSFSHFVVTEHHEGQMAVTSDVKVGTTFHLQFQLH